MKSALLGKSPAGDARDLRSGGKWSLGQRLKNALIRGLIELAIRIADLIPARALVALGRLFGALAYRLLGRERRIALANLAASAHGREAPALARACFVNAGKNLALCLLARRRSFRALDQVELDDPARELIEAAIASGRGVVFVSAHLGPFEWVAAAIAELGYDSSIVVRESYDPGLDALVDAHRLARGLEVIHRGREHAALRTLRALRSGRMLGLLPDIGGRVASIEAQFVVGPTRVPVGPARLALAARCPVLVGTLEPLAGGALPRFRLQIERVALVDDEVAMTQRIMDALTRAISKAPGQWLWMARPLVAEIRGDCRQITASDRLTP